MKRNLVKNLILSVVALSICLSGCGKKVSDTDVYTIDWYLVTGVVPAESETSAVESEVNKYIQEKIGANLKLHYLNWGAYDSKINVMVAGGEKFDICYTQGDTYRLMASKNAFLPLNDLMAKYAPKTKELLGDDFLRGSQIDGINYGLPANKDKGNHSGFVYRKDLAEKYGLTERMDNIKSFDELYPILDIIKEKEPSIAPLHQSGVYTIAALKPFTTIAFPIGTYTDANTVEIVNYVESPEYIEICKKNRQHMEDGYAHMENMESEENYFVKPMSLIPGKSDEMNSTYKYEWVQVDLTTPYMTVGAANGSLMAISRTCKQPEKVMQFLEMFNTDPYLNNLIIYGIEGKHYNKINDNTIEPIKDSGYGNSGMQWEFGNQFINYLVKGEKEDKHKILEEYNSKLLPEKMLGFSFDSEPVKVELGACQNVKAEYENVLATGTGDVDKVLAEYTQKLKAAGADKILEEVKKQYAEWSGK